MPDKPHNFRQELKNILEGAAESVLRSPDEVILEESREEGLQPEHEAEHIRRLLRNAIEHYRDEGSGSTRWRIARRDARIADFLKKTAQELSKFLEMWLPKVADEWWQYCVVKALSSDQQRWVDREKRRTLASLDLAALLRILDYNWYVVSNKASLLPDVRHYLKELRTARNRWAHAQTEGFPDEDVYRDLDTVQRFLTAIGARDDVVTDIQQAKEDLAPHKRTRIVQQDEPINPPSTEFAIGQIVALKSDPVQTGAVIDVIRSTPDNRYSVFIGSEVKTLYSSQLLAAPTASEVQFLSLSGFHAHLSALQILHPGLSTLYSLNAARVDFIPYQFRPVLKFIHSDRPRLLIADSVGVGKTIEAGLILKELQARREVKSVLIICPRQLVVERKWELEMKRFEERFTCLDGKLLQFCISEMDLEGSWPDQHAKTILPFSLFDESVLYGTAINGKRNPRRKGLLTLNPAPRFDLVIVDEAQHIRNPETFAHKGVRFFCDHAEAVVFLTATPIQMGDQDLFVLLNTLRPDLIIDQNSFEHMSAPNPGINRAIDAARAGSSGWQKVAHDSLEDAAQTAWGRSILSRDPEFQRIRTQLASSEITPAERIAVIRQLEQQHTFARVINRTRRRDIGDFTVRKPETVSVDFTKEQKELHNRVLSIQAAILFRLGHLNIGFLMTTIRRQAASCVFGLVPLLEGILTRRLDELDSSESDEDQEAVTSEVIDGINTQIKELLTHARKLPDVDPKLEALRKIVRDKQAMTNNKLIIFSSFRHTLNYLFRKVGSEDCRIGVIHGAVPDDERIVLRTRFRLPRENNDALDLLLFSEIGSEGLDYQFCDCIVNYDIPWNPMRIEQRIGRIDRKGQKSESVAIYNFVTPGTIDAEIYDRCLKRIGVFNKAIGGSEEILGRIAKEIRNVAENIQLTSDERKSKLQQLADNEIRLIQEQEQLEEKQAELFGIRLPNDQARKDVEDASSYWLSPRAIQNLVELYLEKICGGDQEYILGEKPLKTLRMAQAGRDRVLREFQRVPRQSAPVYRQFESWLKGANPHLQITFESVSAAEHPEAAFINPLHPLVRQAAAGLKPKNVVATALGTIANGISAGRYPFALFQWQFVGIRDDVVLTPITEAVMPSAKVVECLEYGQAVHDVGMNDDKQTLQKLEAEHYSRWVKAKVDHSQRVERLANYRRESLTTSHNARIAMLQDQLAAADNDKIRIMRRAQLANAEADYERRMKELDEAVAKADILAQLVGWGVIEVKQGQGAEL